MGIEQGKGQDGEFDKGSSGLIVPREAGQEGLEVPQGPELDELIELLSRPTQALTRKLPCGRDHRALKSKVTDQTALVA